MALSPNQVIVLATPVFFGLIGIEYAWGVLKGRNTYRLNDAINSISLGMLSQVTGVLLPLLKIGLYAAVFSHVALWRNDAFWTSWYGWIVALLFYDFCYYWLHRAGHEVAIFWAAHVVHHQSQDYNLSTALRQTSTGHLLGWIFYLPMALAGVPPLVFAVAGLIDLLYQFWVHTEQVGKLGAFDRWFCSPSNHRVHHAVNDAYMDRNYGGVLIVWDRLFGSFVEEGEKCVYGTRAPLESWDPLWANVEVYASLARDSWRARSWPDKLRVWFKPPGWRPDDVAARFPKPPFDIAKVQRFHPPMSGAMLSFAALQFVALLACAVTYLWNADAMPARDAFVWLAALVASVWAAGVSMQGRLAVLEVLMIEAAALAMASGTLGIASLHYVTKPLVIVLAIAFVATRSQGRSNLLLCAALACSLAGDAFLMVPGYFIPGLVSFLVAHLCYIALFKEGVAWLPSRRALGIIGAIGLFMYAFLFPHLPPVLKIAVAAYCTVICSMAAQAIGRATVLRDPAAVGVAFGAAFFMLSDATLAINRFAVPVPMGQFIVLATYYLAQGLIVHNARRAATARSPAGLSATPA
jgi:sterol desaturase/sphingolipid hydroxylase (fatty acid hydroxylase superfamily)/uncharacterized membrane protein YhhN